MKGGDLAKARAHPLCTHKRPPCESQRKSLTLPCERQHRKRRSSGSQHGAWLDQRVRQRRCAGRRR